MTTFVYPGQSIAKRVRFPVALDSTPTLSVFVNGVFDNNNATITGSGALWRFVFSTPIGSESTDTIQVEVEGISGGIPVYVQILDATVGVWEELMLPSSGGILSGVWGTSRHGVLTLQDMVHSLTLRSGAEPDRGHNSRMVKAVQTALKSLHAKHPWNYYKQQTRFTTSPQISMEVEYDRTGGQYERLVTITSNHTWPDDAEMGEIFIAGVGFRILRRLSDTSATLESDHSMPRDYTGSATWRRRAYSFGREVIKVEYCHNVSSNRQITSLPYHEFNALSFSPVVIGNTRHFTWQNHGGRFGGSEFILHPAPITKEIIEVSASVMPIVPHIHYVYGDDLSGLAGTNEVTCPGGSFTKKLAGSVIRISAGDAPMGYDSELWDFQAFVTDVVNGTTLLVSETLTEDFSGGGYVISSPLDIESSIMMEALEDEAFYQYTKNHDHKQATIASEMARKSLLEAMSRDKRVGENSMDSGSPFWHWNKTDFSQNIMEQ